MNIYDLQPRVFYRGKIHPVKQINYRDSGALVWIQEKGGTYIPLEQRDDFNIDRPVGMIKDRHGKGVVLYENDILRAYTYIDEEEPENSIYEDSVITWCGNLPDYSHYYAFEAFPREDVDYNYIASIFNDLEYVGVEIIGNVHENPDLAPDWWKNRNDSQ